MASPALVQATTMGQSIKLSELIKSAPEEVNKPIVKGGSFLLHLAVACNQYECAKVLVEEGKAKVHLSDKDFRTALHVAASLGNLELVNLLVKAGANVNALDKDNATPLFLCGECNEPGIGANVVEYLAKNGANVDAANSSGRTPLMMAAKAKNFAILVKLVKLGADVTLKDIYKMDALDYSEGDPEVKTLFSGPTAIPKRK